MNKTVRDNRFPVHSYRYAGPGTATERELLYLCELADAFKPMKSHLQKTRLAMVNAGMRAKDVAKACNVGYQTIRIMYEKRVKIGLRIAKKINQESPSISQAIEYPGGFGGVPRILGQPPGPPPTLPPRPR